MSSTDKGKGLMPPSTAPDMPSHSGYVAIVGRPNVGKSTLLNALLGQKISITSKKPQTTRHQILGIKTVDHTQIIYVDTPGIHVPREKALSRVMNRAAFSALADVNLVLFVIDRTAWREEDELVFDKLQNLKCPIVLIINKIDLLEDKRELLPFIEKLSERLEYTAIMPMSALNNTQVVELEKEITRRIPEGPHYFERDQVTDRSSRFMAAEIVREKLMRRLGEEIPYQSTVEIESFKEDGRLTRIDALILVQREGQKKIIIGEKGSQLKQIGIDARLDLEKLLSKKVMLRIWVKVRRGWSDDERALRSLGYDS